MPPCSRMRFLVSWLLGCMLEKRICPTLLLAVILMTKFKSQFTQLCANLNIVASIMARRRDGDVA
jgi:hypothetical protein